MTKNSGGQDDVIIMILLIQEVNREMQIKSFDGKSYYLVEVIAFFLQYLKSKFVSHLSRSRTPTENFDWVITVPAIWRASGKQMMREAAYLVSMHYCM